MHIRYWHQGFKIFFGVIGVMPLSTSMQASSADFQKQCYGEEEIYEQNGRQTVKELSMYEMRQKGYLIYLDKHGDTLMITYNDQTIQSFHYSEQSNRYMFEDKNVGLYLIADPEKPDMLEYHTNDLTVMYLCEPRDDVSS